MKEIYALDHLGRSTLKPNKRENVHKVATQSCPLTSDLESDQTHVTLQDNPNCSVIPLYRVIQKPWSIFVNSSILFVCFNLIKKYAQH
jgi:hypothetical protein